MQSTEEDIGMLQGPQQDFKQATVARILSLDLLAATETVILIGLIGIAGFSKKNAQDPSRVTWT